MRSRCLAVGLACAGLMGWCCSAAVVLDCAEKGALSEGNERIFLYGMHGHTALGVMPSFAILVGADGGPSPECAAFSQFARVLEGMRFVSKENYGERGLVFDFTDKTAGHPGTLRVYTDLMPAEARALARRTDCLDLYGNPTDGTRPTDESVLYGLPSRSERGAWTFASPSAKKTRCSRVPKISSRQNSSADGENCVELRFCACVEGAGRDNETPRRFPIFCHRGAAVTRDA